MNMLIRLPNMISINDNHRLINYDHGLINNDHRMINGDRKMMKKYLAIIFRILNNIFSHEVENFLMKTKNPSNEGNDDSMENTQHNCQGVQRMRKYKERK